MSPDYSCLIEILDLLSQTKKAHTITDISNILGHDRRTVSYILNHLLLSGKVEMRQHGQKKKFYLTDHKKNSLSSSCFPLNNTSFLLVLNPDFTLRWANPGCIQITDLPFSMLEGKHLNALKCPIINNFAIISHLSALQADDICTFEESFIMGGLPVTYLYTLAYVSISAKDDIIILSGHDITDIKQKEQKYISHEQKLNLLTENIPGAIFRRYLPTNHIEFFNSLFQEFSEHLTLEKTIGYLNIIDADIEIEDRENYIDTLQLSLITDSEYEVEYRINTRHGNFCYLLERGRPVKDALGNQIYIDGFILNITDKKQIEDSLKESEERFRIFADLAPVGIYITDHLGACRFINREWCRQTGLTPAEAADRGWIISINEEARDKKGSKGESKGHTKGPSGNQYSFLSRKGEEVWVHTTTAELKNRSGEVIGYIGCNVDITERKLLEEEIKEREGKFMELLENKMPEEFYSRFYAILADINAPTPEISGLNNNLFPGRISKKNPGHMIHEGGFDLPGSEGHRESGQTMDERSCGETPSSVHSLLSDRSKDEAQLSGGENIFHESTGIESKYRRLYEALPIGYVTLDLDGTIMEINSTGAALLYYKKRNPVGRHIHQFIAEKSLFSFQEFLMKFQNSEKVHSCPALLFREDTSPFPVILKGIRSMESTSNKFQVNIAIIEV